MSKQETVVKLLMAQRSSIRNVHGCEDANAVLDAVLGKEKLTHEEVQEIGAAHPGRQFLFKTQLQRRQAARSKKTK